VLITTLSSRDFNHGVSAAKKAANDGLVFITDRGKPAHVLMTIDQYHALANQKQKSLLELMDAMPNAGDGDFEVPRLNLKLTSADFG
jgi:PHD/YefM family antitoxin component YafN of YafNO toxin-antitoxin module